MCGTVMKLDDQVHRGLVRRQAAACIASTPTFAGGYFSSTLLRCVLQGKKHRSSDCTCLESVLAWGCCPTQLQLWPPSEERWVSISTAVHLALQRRETRPQWVRILLTYGCIPCQQYRQLTNKVTGKVTLVPEHDSTPWFKSRMLEWARWHRRCRKRQWITAGMVL
jgi:hypothetical protein